MHATWNAIVKGSGDTLMTTIAVAGGAMVVAAAALPFLPLPARESWPFLAASTLLQIAYYGLVARTYHIADMGMAYPLMRGSAPMLVALFSAFFLGEMLPTLAWAGLAVLCAGIFAMAGASGRGAGRKGMGLALLNACAIAGYTLVDGAGVRVSGSPAAYILWITLLPGLLLSGWAMLWRRQAFRAYLARRWHLGLLGGAGAVLSYGLALWAMTRAPVAIVAALRETSILFGALIAMVILKEKLGMARLVPIGLIAAGAMLLRLT